MHKRFFFRHKTEDGSCPAKTRGTLSEEEIRARKYHGLRESEAHKRIKQLIGVQERTAFVAYLDFEKMAPTPFDARGCTYSAHVSNAVLKLLRHENRWREAGTVGWARTTDLLFHRQAL